MMALYHRDVHGGDGPARRRQPDRAAGPAHRDVDALVRPARRSSPAGSATASTPARPATPTAPPTTGGSPSRAPRRPSRVRVFRAIGRPDLAEDPDYVDPVRRQARGERGRRARGRLGRGPGRSTRRWRCSRPPRSPPRRSTTPSSCSPTSTSSPAARSSRSTTPTSAPMTVQAPVARMSETPGRVEHLGRALGADNDAVLRRAARPRPRPPRPSAPPRSSDRLRPDRRPSGSTDHDRETDRAGSPSPTIRAGHAGQQREDVREGRRLGRRPRLPRPRGRLRAVAKEPARGDRGRRADRARTGVAPCGRFGSTGSTPRGATATSSRSSPAPARRSTSSSCRRPARRATSGGSTCCSPSSRPSSA